MSERSSGEAGDKEAVQESTGSVRRLRVLRNHTRVPSAAEQELVLTFDELRQRGALRSLLRYPEVVLHTYRADTLTRPFLTQAWLRSMCRGTCQVQDERGQQVPVTVSRLVGQGWRALRDYAGLGALRRRVRAQLGAFEAETELRGLEQGLIGPAAKVSWNRQRGPVYLRTDPWFGISAGGSVGHIAGVLNHLGEFGPAPLFLTTDEIPTVSPQVETHCVAVPRRFLDIPRALALAYDRAFEAEAAGILQARPPGFIYARYALNSYAGVRLARKFNVPFVLEYNGSEIWIQRNWGRALPDESLALRIEELNLQGADLIVVVSEALCRELRERGVPDPKILVNPNGVDTDRFRPDLDGTTIRKKFELADHTVLGFIGTFGPWHGAATLAEAYGRLLATQPRYRDKVRLLWIGDGEHRASTEQILERYGVRDCSVFAGRVPQAEAPEHLAACDVLVSPHVPNPDGSEFFGSPTKLFEYMALGRGIVASDLAQIGDVLAHDETAWLTTPGDPDALAHGCRTLIDDIERRQRLGSAARTLAEQKYTWREHTRKILDHLGERTQ